jgi:hypothetical protein
MGKNNHSKITPNDSNGISTATDITGKTDATVLSVDDTSTYSDKSQEIHPLKNDNTTPEADQTTASDDAKTVTEQAAGTNDAVTEAGQAAGTVVTATEAGQAAGTVVTATEAGQATGTVDAATEAGQASGTIDTAPEAGRATGTVDAATEAGLATDSDDAVTAETISRIFSAAPDDETDLEQTASSPKDKAEQPQETGPQGAEEAPDDTAAADAISEFVQTEDAPATAGTVQAKAADSGKPPRKRKPSRDEEIARKSSKAVPLALLIIFAALAAVYCGLAQYYKDHFLPGSTINEVNVSGMEAAEAKSAIQADIRNYLLQVQGRKSKDFISSEGLGLTLANPEDVDTILSQQDRWAWPLYFNRISEAELDLRWSVDEAALHERVSGMNALKEENITSPTDAYISDSGSDTKVIIPETQGSQPDPDKLYSVIFDAVTNGVDEIDIDEAGCYLTPVILRDDKNLNDRLDQWNGFLRSVGLTYDYSDRKEVLDYNTLCGLLIDDGEKVYINEDAVANLVQEWKQKYDTFGRSRQFRTHGGSTITVTGGDYGWVIKKNDTVAEVISYITAGDNGTHTPPYSYKAKSRATNDIGDTYVEISISSQRMWFYKNGECVVDTPVVTGNPNRGNSTQKGCYAIDAKKSPAVLKGQGYESHVVYWMPFNGNQGIHDADNWRSSYGGSIYLTNGSHGCVNTPRNKVKTIYENVEIGTPVIVY